MSRNHQHAFANGLQALENRAQTTTGLGWAFAVLPFHFRAHRPPKRYRRRIPTAEGLEDRQLMTGLIATAQEQAYSALVNIYDAKTGSLRSSLNPYPDRRAPAGGIHLAFGDVNGDGAPDVIVAPNGDADTKFSNMTRDVRVLDGRSGKLISSFAPYNARDVTKQHGSNYYLLDPIDVAADMS
jgi:hypothetical protein